MSKLAAPAFALLLGWTLLAGAGDRVLRSDELLARQQATRAELEAGTGRYQGMPEARRKAVLADQQTLAALLEGKTDTSQLGSAERDQAFSLVASIEAALARGSDERLICTREARTGSNYMVRVCRTQAQIREQQNRAQEDLQDEAGRVKCNERNGCT